MIYYNYYYRNPAYIRKLQRVIKSIYIKSIAYTPRGYDASINCMCYNLVRMVKFDVESCYVLMRKDTTPPSPIINGHKLGDVPSQTNTVRLINLLESMGLVSVYRGYRVSSTTRESSFMCISEELIDMVRDNVDMNKVKMQPYEDVLVLKDEEKNQIEYMKSPKIRKMINQLNRFNDELGKHIIEDDRSEILVSFKRVFNDCSFELGGRFYTHDGSVQVLSSEDRKSIRIDGEQCVELDFKGLHLALLYEKEGRKWLDGFDPYNADLSECCLVYYDQMDSFVKRNCISPTYNPVRNISKMASVIMVNASNMKEAERALRKKFEADKRKEGTPDEHTRMFAGIDPVSLDLEMIIDEMAAHNRDIEHYFNSGYGKELQFADSEIMSGVIQDFIDAGKVCLPVHDSAIAKKSDQAFLLDSMIKNYERVLGSKFNCFVEVKW